MGFRGVATIRREGLGRAPGGDHLFVAHILGEVVGSGELCVRFRTDETASSLPTMCGSEARFHRLAPAKENVLDHDFFGKLQGKGSLKHAEKWWLSRFSGLSRGQTRNRVKEEKEHLNLAETMEHNIESHGAVGRGAQVLPSTSPSSSGQSSRPRPESGGGTRARIVSFDRGASPVPHE